MAILCIALITMKDTSWADAYSRDVPAMVHAQGGRFLVQSGQPSLIEGDAPVPDSIAVLEFPSMDHVDALLAMPEYQPYLEARLAGADTVVYALTT